MRTPPPAGMPNFRHDPRSHSVRPAILPYRGRRDESPGLRVQAATYGDFWITTHRQRNEHHARMTSETGGSTRTAPGMLRTLPAAHAVAVAVRCGTQLHLGVQAELPGSGHQPEQLATDVVADFAGLAIVVTVAVQASQPVG